MWLQIAIASVSHTRYFRFSPKIPLPTRHARSPLATAQGAAVKERGRLTAALSSRAENAVPRDGSRKFICLLKDCLMHFKRNLGHPKITLRIKTRAFACKQCAFLILAIFGFRRVAAAGLGKSHCAVIPASVWAVYPGMFQRDVWSRAMWGWIGEDSRQKLSRKSFSTGDFRCDKNIFCRKRLIFSCFYAAMPCDSSTYYQCISIYIKYYLTSLYAESTESLSEKSIKFFAEGIEKRLTL